jgi:hypothetical protein
MRGMTGGGGIRYADGFRSDGDAKAYRDAVVASVELREVEGMFARDDAARGVRRGRPGATAASDLREINEALRWMR